jgi:hypothetical protein
VFPPPIEAYPVPTLVVHTVAPDGQSVRVHSAVDRSQGDSERPELVQKPLPLVLDRATTTEAVEDVAPEGNVAAMI